MSLFVEARDDDDDRIEVGSVSRYKTKGKYRERERRGGEGCPAEKNRHARRGRGLKRSPPLSSVSVYVHTRTHSFPSQGEESCN